MAELLLELFSEEIPARMQAVAANELKERLCQKLTALNIPYSGADSYVTPRRLTFVAQGLPTTLADTTEEKKGPRVGSPTNAIEGFAAGAGTTVDKLETRQTDKGEFYFYTLHQKGLEPSALIRQCITEILDEFNWPKSMRWGARAFRWVRPLQNILCLFDGKTLPLTYNHLTANNHTSGHRFMAGESFEVSGFTDYQHKLKEHFVILDREERKTIIAQEAAAIAAKYDYHVKADQGLLEEVTGLIEWPVVLVGAIDAAFMDVPKEVLSTAMRTHQKYFSLLKEDGSLAPHFLLVSNMQPKDKGAKIVAGNERVLRARLSDAKFFWDHDRKKSLSARVATLDTITFHTKLGTVGDKVKRITKLAARIATDLRTDSKLVQRASMLCKADLVSDMVMEFPELQGQMGYYYALHDGEDNQVAEAIADHYKPLGPGDNCPSEPISAAVALADKLDTMAGLFAAGEKPTGSKDPFALRRAALGVIRIILENQLHLKLKDLFEAALAAYPTALVQDKAKTTSELMEFFADRLKASLKSQDVRHDLINAVFDGGVEDDLLLIVRHVTILQNFITSENGKHLLAAYKRASNIVFLEEKKDKTSYKKEPSRNKLIQKEEYQLFDSFEQVKSDIEESGNNFEVTLTLLGNLREPIDQFFEQVTVNCDNPDIRHNRLMMLSKIRGILDGLANFSLIEG